MNEDKINSSKHLLLSNKTSYICLFKEQIRNISEFKIISCHAICPPSNNNYYLLKYSVGGLTCPTTLNGVPTSNFLILKNQLDGTLEYDNNNPENVNLYNACIDSVDITLCELDGSAINSFNGFVMLFEFFLINKT